MNPEILDALNDSIAHWERLASGKRKPNESVGIYDCALCRMFNKHSEDGSDTRCKGCPVKEKTGIRFCKATPFVRAEEITEDLEIYDSPEEAMNSSEFKEAAQEELEFLKSLLPKISQKSA